VLEEDDPELFLVALRNVAEAQVGAAQLKSLDALLHALRFRLDVTGAR
jgi:hypothetical protein